MLLVDCQFSYDDGVPMRFNLTLPEGGLLGVTGPSGAGKSTLFSLLAGFLKPQSGQLTWQGQILDGAPHTRPFSLMFQSGNLFDHLTAEENAALALSQGRTPTSAQRKAAVEALGQLGLAGLEHRKPAELSGGQQGRVALARSLCSDKPVLLLDEPFAALDPSSRTEALDAVRSVHQSGKSILLITHAQSDLDYLGADCYRLGQD